MDAYGLGGQSFVNPEITARQFGLQKGMKVADLGVGRGFYAEIVARLVGETGIVTCADVIQDALDHLRASASAKGLHQMRFVRCDLEVTGSTQLPDNSQDFALLANVLFQSQKKDMILREAYRILQPGGRLCVIDWRPGSGGFGAPENLRTSAEEMTRLATSVGFRPLSTIDVGGFHYGLMFIK